MKLWTTTTENKCFVKMLWHLLGKCVKVTVFLVCSSGAIPTVAKIFFFFPSVFHLYFFFFINVQVLL